MRRRFSGWVVGLLVAGVVAVCACDDGEDAQPSSSGAGVDCSPYVTCGTCTPVRGCGWCFGVSGGTCASDPDQCAFASNTEFTWTWDPEGCPSVDASVHPGPAPKGPDAGIDVAAGPEASVPVRADEAGTATTDAAGGDRDDTGVDSAPSEAGIAVDAAEEP